MEMEKTEKQTKIVKIEDSAKLKNLNITPIPKIDGQLQNLNVVCKIVSAEPEKMVTTKDGLEYVIRNCVVKDALVEHDEGLNLTLWNNDVFKFRVGDVVLIKNGYSRVFMGLTQISPGKYGTIEIL